MLFLLYAFNELGRRFVVALKRVNPWNVSVRGLYRHLPAPLSTEVHCAAARLPWRVASRACFWKGLKNVCTYNRVKAVAAVKVLRASTGSSRRADLGCV